MEKIDQNAIWTLVDLNRIAANIPEHNLRALELICSKGISQEHVAIELIREQTMLLDKHYPSDAAAWRTVKYLLDIGFFTTKKINTGRRSFNILLITDLGERVYMSIFKKAPAKFEHQIIAKAHDNAEHGYIIIDVAKILEDKHGYYGVSIDRIRNTIELADGQRCIPDIRAIRAGQVDVFEVECGNHHQADFDQKLDKLARVTDCIHIVCPNRRVVEKVKKQVDHWIDLRGRFNLLRKGISVKLTSVTDLDNGKWTYIYDLSYEEPICCFNKKKKGGENI